jgi:hypothetical protein
MAASFDELTARLDRRFEDLGRLRLTVKVALAVVLAAWALLQLRDC